MDNFKCRIVDLARDFKSGNARVTIESDSNILGTLEALQDKDLDCRLIQHREKRSLNANSYMWVLISKLEQELSKMTSEPPKTTYIRVTLSITAGRLNIKYRQKR